MDRGGGVQPGGGGDAARWTGSYLEGCYHWHFFPAPTTSQAAAASVTRSADGDLLQLLPMTGQLISGFHPSGTDGRDAG